MTLGGFCLDTQIISKRAVYIIMLISGRISFFLTSYACPQVTLFATDNPRGSEA